MCIYILYIYVCVYIYIYVYTHIYIDFWSISTEHFKSTVKTVKPQYSETFTNSSKKNHDESSFFRTLSPTEKGNIAARGTGDEGMATTHLETLPRAHSAAQVTCTGEHRAGSEIEQLGFLQGRTKRLHL